MNRESVKYITDKDKKITGVILTVEDYVVMLEALI